MPQHPTDTEQWIDQQLLGHRERFSNFTRKVFADGALDRKSKELIAAAVSSVRRCPALFEQHRNRAHEAGATEAEIAEALAVPWVQGGGTQVFWMVEDFADVLGEDWRQELIGEADRAFWTFKREVYEDGALPEKTKQLIAVAVSSALRCRVCTGGHLKGALEAGATRAEIAEALGVLWATGSRVEVAWSGEAVDEHRGSPAHV